MIEIRVQCDCGQRFKFDIEPPNGLMPYTVNCPVCGADGTQKANGILAQTMGQAVPARVASPPMRVAVTPPPAASSVTAPPPAPSASLVEVPSPESPSPAPMAVKGAASAPKPAQNFAIGVLGAVACGTVAMIAWFLLIKVTGYEIGFAAWGVGLLTGFGARVLAKAGSTALGLTAGACAFLAILGGQFLCAKSVADKFIDQAASEAYTERMAYAQEAAKAQTDDEIKAVLAKHEGNNEPGAADIAEFKSEELRKLKDLASGKTSKAQFENEIRGIKSNFAYQFILLKETVGLFTLLWLFLGVSSAYKLGAS